VAKIVFRFYLRPVRHDLNIFVRVNKICVRLKSSENKFREITMISSTF